jgi:rubrerythrin
MAELEKVIKGLEEAKEYFRECRNNASIGSKAENHFWELQNAMNEAADLLKAQDETRLIYHYSRPNVYADLWLHCEKCGEKVDNQWRPKYCPGCGRAVKWDE